MSDVSCVVTEGRVKYRDGKKWKPRWCVLRKPSPVADQLNVQLYKVDVKDVHKRQPKANFNLEGFYGLETGFSYDKESNVLAIVCQKQVTLFSFENRDNLIQFEIKIRRSLGEEDQFKVRVTNVPNNSRLPLDLLRMHIHRQKFCLTNGVPPKVLATWQISDLRKFGVVDKKFIFEGGSNCGKGAGVHAFASEDAELINEIIGLASQGKTASCRKSIKRRSQLYDYHLEPLNSSFSDNTLYRDFQNLQSYADQNFYEDKRSKRHSLSFTDFSHASAYNEKHLRNKNELETGRRNHPLYDVPPSRIRKVDNANLYLNTKQFQCQTHCLSQNSQEIKNVSNILSQKFSKECVDSRIEQWIESEACLSSGSGPSSDSQMSISSGENYMSALGHMAKVSASAPSLCGYGVYGCPSEDNTSVSVASVPSKIEEELEQCRRIELENLQKSEQDLQREITLLEEIMKGVNDKPRGKTTDHLAEKPPPLPRKKSRNHRRATLSPRLDRYSTISSQGSISGFSDSVLLSPNLVSRLRKIPSHSKMSAPLPYVNLDKYDGGRDVDKCHVYVRNQSDDDACSIVSHRSGSYDNESISPKDQYLRKVDGQSPKIPIGLPESNYANTECIYANDYAAQEAALQPPALPPKGPALLRKSRPLCPPPIPPAKHRAHLFKRNKYSSQYSSPKKGVNPVMSPIREPNYLLMAGVDASPNTRRRSELSLRPPCSGSSEFSEFKEGPLKVILPKRSPSSSGKENLNPDDACGYMDMSGMFEDERVTMKSKDEVESSDTPQKMYTRSSSASSVAENHFSRPVLHHSHSLSDAPSSGANTLVREENYLLMHHLTNPKKSVIENLQSLKSFVSNTRAIRASVIEGDCASVSSSVEKHNLKDNASNNKASPEKTKEILKGKSSLPFPNLINFEKHNILKVSSQDVHRSVSSTSVQPAPNEKNADNSGKSPGFLTRLIRRNSGNRKSMSQSQENLLNSSSSESCLDKTLSNIHVCRENASVKDLSTSSVLSATNSSVEQNQPEMVERRRSSSFPNRSSFMEMNNTATKETFHQTSQDSFYSNGTTDEHRHLIGADQAAQSNDTDSTGSSSTNRTGYTGPCDGHTDSEDSASKTNAEGKCMSPKSFQKFQKTQEMGIFTVLRVDEPSYKLPLCQTSSKTDDEKLIDLMKYSKVKDYYGDTDSEKTNSLKSDDFKLNMCPKKAFSPNEEAAAIAKYVASLAPFIPPKQKSYPSSALSPVLENSPAHGREELWKEDAALDDKSCKSFRSEHSYAMISPTDHDESVSKGEEAEESIWVPRQSVKEGSPASVSSTVEDPDSRSTAVVVELDRESASDDDISLSSNTDSLCSENAVRNSPAHTIMRPRAGNCYIVLERKRPLNESVSSSPSQTPRSPSINSSVFTFDQVSQFSSLSRERDSPNLPKFSRSESLHSKFSERSSHKMSFMTIDLTPPSSPPFSQSLSLSGEQPERQLNYAEIDLRDKPARKSRKASQKSLKMQKSTSIEYAMIDMEATIAIQRAGQEHKMSRVDSLKRSDQKLSLSIPETDTEDFPEPSPSSTKDETASQEGSTFLTTHKYVNVPPPKEEEAKEEKKEDGADLPEKILLPIRENQDTSSSESEDEEEDSDSSDGEVIVIE